MMTADGNASVNWNRVEGKLIGLADPANNDLRWVIENFPGGLLRDEQSDLVELDQRRYAADVAIAIINLCWQFRHSQADLSPEGRMFFLRQIIDGALPETREAMLMAHIATARKVLAGDLPREAALELARAVAQSACLALEPAPARESIA